MKAIADSSHQIAYPETAVPKTVIDSQGRPSDAAVSAIIVDPTSIDSMKRCLAYKKDQRLTIPELLHHEFLRPQAKGTCKG